MTDKTASSASSSANPPLGIGFLSVLLLMAYLRKSSGLRERLRQ